MTPPTPTEVKAAAIERTVRGYVLCSRFSECSKEYDYPCPCAILHEYDPKICAIECQDYPGAKCKPVSLIWD